MTAWRWILFSLTMLAVVASAADVVFVDDHAIHHELIDRTVELLEHGQTASIETLRGQLSRTQYPLRLETPPKGTLSAEQIFQKCRDGVLVVCAIKKGGKHNPYLVSPAAGFVLTREGVIVTNYHVVNQTEALAFSVRTFDGKFYGVKEVLAADKDRDVAVLQLNGTGFTPVALASAAPVGSPVTVISHPDQNFYTVTAGIVSRYFIQQNNNVGRLAITADFAKGSSGAPIFNAAGAVIGMVTSTESIYYDEHNGEQHNLQMVLKTCVTSDSIRQLLTAPAPAPRNPKK